jgi:hypothetical protein
LDWRRRKSSYLENFWVARINPYERAESSVDFVRRAALFLSSESFSAIQKFYTFDKKFVLGMIFEILYNLLHLRGYAHRRNGRDGEHI